MAVELRLELYITGQAPNSMMATANLQRICRGLAGRLEVELHTVDVLEDPDAAEEANVIATPTLIRRFPLPVRRIVGDLSDLEVVISALGIEQDDTEPGDKEAQ